jgi:predicted MFS family arabinose efflux permease
VPQVLASIRTIFPVAEQPRALGYFGSIFGLAAITGQICGGLLIALHPLGLGWQSIFLVNVPIGCVALVAAAVLLRENRSTNPSRLDLPGILLLSLTLVLLVIPLVEGPDHGWPAWTIIGLAAVVPLLLLFLAAVARLRRRGAAPLVDLRLFRTPAFSVGLLMTFLFNGGATFFLTYAIYLQNGLGWGALPSGLAILPFAVGFFLTPMMSSGLMGRLGAGILNLGFGLLAGGFGTVATVLYAHGGPWGIPGVVMYAGLFAAGVGQGFVLPSLVRTVLQAVRPQDAGLASGVLNTTLQISTAIGTAIIGGVFFAIIGPAPSQASHTLAFAVALSCIVALELLSFVLALLLLRLTRQARRQMATH